MEKLYIVNGAGQMIQEGTAVTTPEDPSERWIVHFGWYHLDLPGSYTMMAGWYMTRVSDGHIASITEPVLSTLVVLCDGHPVTCPCYPTPVTPGPAVPHPNFVGATIHTIDGIIAVNSGVAQTFGEPAIFPEFIQVNDVVVGTNGCIATVTKIGYMDEDLEDLQYLTVMSTGTMLARSDTCEAQQSPEQQAAK